MTLISVYPASKNIQTSSCLYWIYFYLIYKTERPFKPNKKTTKNVQFTLQRLKFFIVQNTLVFSNILKVDLILSTSTYCFAIFMFNSILLSMYSKTIYSSPKCLAEQIHALELILLQLYFR